MTSPWAGQRRRSLSASRLCGTVSLRVKRHWLSGRRFDLAGRRLYFLTLRDAAVTRWSRWRCLPYAARPSSVAATRVLTGSAESPEVSVAVAGGFRSNGCVTGGHDPLPNDGARVRVRAGRHPRREAADRGIHQLLARPLASLECLDRRGADTPPGYPCPGPKVGPDTHLARLRTAVDSVGAVRQAADQEGHRIPRHRRLPVQQPSGA
jgi:hypothetical protein